MSARERLDCLVAADTFVLVEAVAKYLCNDEMVDNGITHETSLFFILLTKPFTGYHVND